MRPPDSPVERTVSETAFLQASSRTAPYGSKDSGARENSLTGGKFSLCSRQLIRARGNVAIRAIFVRMRGRDSLSHCNSYIIILNSRHIAVTKGLIPVARRYSRDANRIHRARNTTEVNRLAGERQSRRTLRCAISQRSPVLRKLSI